jgi:hypothetical protein
VQRGDVVVDAVPLKGAATQIYALGGARRIAVLVRHPADRSLNCKTVDISIERQGVAPKAVRSTSMPTAAVSARQRPPG